MATYNEIRKQQAGQVMQAENAQAMQQNAAMQEQNEAQLREQENMLKQQEEEAMFNQAVNKAMTPNNALEMYKQVMQHSGSDPMTGMPMNGNVAGQTFEDQQRMAQIREAQMLQSEADAQQMAANQGGYIDPSEANMRAEYEREQVMRSGAPDPRSQAVQNDAALAAYMQARTQQ